MSVRRFGRALHDYHADVARQPGDSQAPGQPARYAARMRLWTLHPRHLDAKGIVALWREGLLARKVLAGRTVGYRHHPQLARFRAQKDPLAAIDSYLEAVRLDAERRGYRFDGRKLGARRTSVRIAETTGQVEHERAHLSEKLRRRDPAAYRELLRATVPDLHPLFRRVAGKIREWERAAPLTGSRGSPSRRPSRATRSPRDS
jgi:Pyrimidine dimer DNA glycosylase